MIPQLALVGIALVLIEARKRRNLRVIDAQHLEQLREIERASRFPPPPLPPGVRLGPGESRS